MGSVRTDEFRKDTVRIALTSGLSRKQISDDLGVGMSTLNKWITSHRDKDVLSPEDRELALENKRLRRENRTLREERDTLKESHPVLREPKAVRFRFVEEHIGAFPTDRLCQVMNVSPRGLRAFRSRPASRRQRMDMVVLAHIKEQPRLKLGSYGRPRMTEELKEVGVDVGHRRVGRLMRENGIVVERTRKFKVRRDKDLIQWIKSPDARRIAAIRSTSHETCWTVTSRQMDPTRSGRAISATSGPVRAGCILR